MERLKPYDAPVRRLLEDLPQKGCRNKWLLKFVRTARHYASAKKIELVLLHIARNYWCDEDFESAIRRAVRRGFDFSAHDQFAPRAIFPKPNPQAIARAASAEPIFDLSPIPVEPSQVIDGLFADNPLLCMGPTRYVVQTKEREAWRGEEDNLQYMVPNAMVAMSGTNGDNKESTRCEGNSAKVRKYLVVESDTISIEQQVGVLSYLDQSPANLVLVVNSANKSLHGWFDVGHLVEEEKFTFFRYAVYLGADPDLWRTSQLARMPGGMRDNGRRQEILYFDNDPAKKGSRR